MNEVLSSGSDVIRHEQVLAAARALASWAHARQATWHDAPVPETASAESFTLSGELITPEWPIDAERTRPVTWRALAACAAALALWGAALVRWALQFATWSTRLARGAATLVWSVVPSMGRALVRFAMAGALMAVIAAVILGGRKGFEYWQRASAARAALAASGATKAVTPAAVEAAPRPAPWERYASSPGTLAALELPELPAGVDGWIKIMSPFKVTVSEDGRPLWFYDDTAKLSSGAHRLRFENRQFGYESEQRIVVHPGGQTTVSVVPPPSTLTINAPSDSEVWIDGAVVGPAPLVAFSISLGAHDVVVKNSAGVERRFRLTVTPAPAVLNVEFTGGAN